MASPLSRQPIVDYLRWLLRQPSGRQVSQRRLSRLIRDAQRRNAGRRFVWAAQRSDGKYWAGPHKWQGVTFTDSPKHIYNWGTEGACRSAILWSGLVNVQPVKVPADRHSDR
jgi:hypothetical protein